MSSPVSTTPKSYTNQQAKIMMLNRASVRNVHIYNANDPSMVPGGLLPTNGATTANFYSMVEISPRPQKGRGWRFETSGLRRYEYRA
ncbi:hypothetical protein B9Z19DRAFT_1135793 [Tuber borchii]|uniref:DUF7881 domain-containing protein n=1 Tax=Tuber borchii TaxID=42251 RepID=A0A2T6ZCI3_TUBBO|nr:hypothetical protein B9Z19DRAFT_1135793 [Tuber borchii]